MRKILIVSLATMLSFGTAQAQEAGIWTEGTLNCALWASAREAKASVSLEHYLLGFINGLALGEAKDFWRYPNSIEPEQVYYWMDKYCANNPLQDVIGGSYALFQERFGEGWYLR
jgi:hypothetical protein